MKRKLAWFGLAFALAELFAAMMPPLVLVPAAALFGLLLFLYWRRKIRIPLLGAVLGLLFFAAYSLVIVFPVQKLAGQTVQCTVEVDTDAQASYQEGYLRGTLRVIACNGKKTDFLVVCDSFPGTKPGECFSAEWNLMPLEEDAYRMSYQSQGVYLRAEYQGGYSAQPDSNAFRFRLYEVRQNLVRIFQRWMPEEESELEVAMLLGEKDGLRDSIQDAFRAAGVSHLLAVSGLHVTLLCGMFSFGRKRRFLRPLILLRGALVVFYMFLTGLPVSVLRAGTVYLIALAGSFFWQPVDLLTSTGAAAVLLGIQNAYAPCDLGFQLSFCAVVGVQGAGVLVRWEKEKIPAKESDGVKAKALALFWWGAESVQVAFFASLATLPVLLAHEMTTSGVSVVTNLLVVWMLQPALQLGVAMLALSALPMLTPVLHMVALLLTVWLRLMIAIVTWCAGLPMARVDLPVRYTLLVLCVMAVLALFFWRLQKLVWYLPSAAVCTVAAIVLGTWAQRDVVRVSMVGAVNNPSTVCIQNGRAIVLFRGGQSNWSVVQAYLEEHALPEITMLVDLRQNPSELDFGDVAVVKAEDCAAYSSEPVLDDLVLDLYHNGSGNLAVIGVGNRHIAVMAGNIELSRPIAVDVLCAAGALSESVQAETILTCTAAPAWQGKTQGETILYGAEDPVITIRPDISMIFEEVEPLALQ